MARGINKVILIGNLGADPEIRYMPTGGAVANITIATSESWTDKNTGEKKEQTEWHRVVVYQRLAEIVGEYLRKGSKVYVEGRLRTRKWQDQQGVERYTTEIIAAEIQMLDRRNDDDAHQGGSPAPQSQGQKKPNKNANQPQGGQSSNQTQGFNQPQGGQGFNQPQGGFNGRGPSEPPIDFDDDIPFGYGYPDV